MELFRSVRRCSLRMTADHDEDVRALRRSQRDPAAFDDVFLRHHASVRRYLHARLGQPELAEDLAAETFARAFAARAGFEDRGHGVQAWLFHIATNLLRDEHRKRTRSPRALSGPAAACEPSLPTDPDLSAQLRALPRAQLEVLLLHAWADLSYEEIADVLKIRVGTVRSRLNRARARMQRELPAAMDPRSTQPHRSTT